MPVLSSTPPTIAPWSFTPRAVSAVDPGIVRVVNLHCADAAREIETMPHNKKLNLSRRPMICFIVPQWRSMLAFAVQTIRRTISTREEMGWLFGTFRLDEGCWIQVGSMIYVSDYERRVGAPAHMWQDLNL